MASRALMPLPERLYNAYDTVIDGGTIEHVFNVPEALKTSMRLVAPGGRFIALSIANNYCGHGLYQLSPELFYRVFSPENGFRVDSAKFYSGGAMSAAPDPGPTLTNGQLPASPHEAMLFVAATKTADLEPFRVRWPSQGQYSPYWETVPELTRRAS